MSQIQTTMFTDVGMAPGEPQTVSMAGQPVRVIVSPEGPLFALPDLGKVLGYHAISSAPHSILSVLRNAGYTDEHVPSYSVPVSIKDSIGRAKIIRLICVGMAGLAAIMSSYHKERTNAIAAWLAAGGAEAVGCKGSLPSPNRGEPLRNSKLSELHIVYIDKRAVRATRIDGSLHLLLADLCHVIGYSTSSSAVIERVFKTCGIDPKGLKKQRFCTPWHLGGFYSPAGVRKLVDVMPQWRTVALRAWIDAGGLEDGGQVAATAKGAALPSAGQETPPAAPAAAGAEVACEPAPAPTEAAATQAPAPSTPADAQPLGAKGYAVKLTDAICRYANEDELAQLTRAIEAEKDRIIRGRYLPGLNDAAYSLYVRHQFGRA